MRFTEPTMRPPQEATSLLPRATQGCTYNKCSFCYVSRGYPFMAVTAEELAAEIAPLQGRYPADTRIYMTGSNPFALPVVKLEEYIGVLRQYFPHFARVSMQARVDDIAGKSDEDLARLGRLGLNHLYIGTESGHDPSLAAMAKGYDATEAVAQLQRLDRAAIGYTCFYLLGMGGRGNGLASGRATAAMFNQIHPTRITTTGLTIFPHTPLAQMVASGEFTPPTEREMVEELREFLRHLTIDVFYDGVHYLNPVNYRFQTGDAGAKVEVLADMDDILANYSEGELEAMVGRAHMRSL